MIKILFVCYGSILNNPPKVSKIDGFKKNKAFTTL